MDCKPQTTTPVRTRALGKTVAAVAAAAMVMTACSSNTGTEEDPGGGQAGASEELTTVEVGTLPVVEAALLMLAEDEGIFEDYGIELNYSFAQGGAAIVPAVVSAQYQIGYSNSISVFQAMEEGLPLSLLNVSATSNGNIDEGTNDLVVRDDDSITSVSELEGKKVAINTFGNLSEVLAKNAIEEGGADPDSVTFVELGFGDMSPALANGEIDSFLAGEPFGTIAKSEGHITLVNTHDVLAPDEQFIFGVWFINTDEADADPELYSNLQQAIEEANAYAHEHPTELREKVPDVTPMEPEVLEAIDLNGYAATLTPEGLEPLAAAAVKYGLLQEEPPYEEVIWAP